MTEISRRLRAARERAGLSLEDISATTKIRVVALQAIERGQFERLAGDFYARGFLKAYAREVHLDPDEIIREYDAGHPAAQLQPEDLVVARRQREPATAAPDDAAHNRRPWAAAWPPMVSMPLKTPAVVTFAVLLLVVTIVKSRPIKNQPREGEAVGTSGVAAAVPSAPAPQPEPAPDKLILEIHPSGPIWVTGAADGNRVLYRLFAPGDHVTVEARNDLTFRIGNAAAFSYAINGMPGKPLGGPDEVREFRITRENYRTFAR